MLNLFIINPVAGSGSADSMVPIIIRAMDELKKPYEIVETEYQHHGADIVRKYAQTGQKIRAYACGGDGSLFDIVNGAVGYSNVEVGSIPCGSGNDFIKYFGDRFSFLDIKSQVLGSSIPVDLIRFEDKYSINIASMGMDAEVVNHKNHRQWLSNISGKFAYNFSLMTAFIFNLKTRLSVTIDDGDTDTRDYSFVVAANGKFYGGSFKPTPEADICDGFMDVMTISNINHFDVMRLLPLYRKGEHLKLDGIVEMHRAKRVKIKAEKEISVNLDGEIFRRKEAEFEIVPHSMQFIIPSVVTAKNEQRNILRSRGVVGTASLDESAR